MTDTTEPDRDLMASAIVDGSADDDLLALVDRDPALADRVAQFRDLRSLLARPEPPTDASRDRAVTAALAVWDADRATTTAAPAAPALAAGRSRWWLGVAAAAVVAAALGVVVANTDRGSDTTGDAIESAATVMTDEEQAEAQDAASSPGSDTGSSEETSDLMIAGAPATDAATDAGDVSEAAEAAPESPAAGAGMAELIGPDALAAFAEAGRTAPQDVDTDCELADVDVVGSARYAPSADVEAVEVVVGRRGDTTVVAVDVVTCDVVAAVPAG